MESEARKKAHIEYLKRHDIVNVSFRDTRAEKERITQHASKYNENLSEFLRRAVAETMERDNQKKLK